MNTKFVFAFLVTTSALSVLIYAAASNTAKAVTTVDELVSEGTLRKNIRLGARVASDDIDYQTKPEFLVKFKVHDIPAKSEQSGTPRETLKQNLQRTLPGTVMVAYKGVMPDTLKAQRDVILEGDFDGTTFHASSLLTQCPSKYEVPEP